MNYRQRDPVGAMNLDHALQDICSDPDCEIHSPEVGYAEETVDLTNYAFYVAGFMAGMAALSDQYNAVKGNLRDEIKQMLTPQEGQ